MPSTDYPEPRNARLPSNERIVLDGAADQKGWTINWSRDGLCMLCDRLLEVGDQLHVDLPERHERGIAKVIWVRRHHDGCIAGLELVSMDRHPC